MLLQKIVITFSIVFLIFVFVSQINPPEPSNLVDNQSSEEGNQVDIDGVVMESETNEVTTTEEIKREPEVCDYESLTIQLEKILEADGWYQYEVPLVSVSSTKITEYPYGNQDLPFNYSEVCTVKFFFEESHLDWLDGASSPKNFWHDYSYQEDYVELGSQRFYGNPADGPLSSSDVIPILSATGGLQYLVQSSGTSVTEFRPEIKCPCTNYYEAWLTAPMFPVGEGED